MFARDLELTRLSEAIRGFLTAYKAFEKQEVQAVRAKLLEVTKVQNKMQSKLEMNSDLCGQLHGIIKSLSGVSP